VIIGTYNDKTGEHTPLTIDIQKKNGQNVITNVSSPYAPDLETRKVISAVKDDFRKADVIMRRPRREFNDLSVISRMQVDQMAFNCYQPNNGDALEGDEINSWKSRAMRPIVRNKAISIAAHATSNVIFPKIFAYDKSASNEDDQAAGVMSDLMEWAGEQSDYFRTNLYAVVAALINPASIVFEEYTQVYKKYKTDKNDKGDWNWEEVIDEDASGFQNTIVPVDELYIGNFYEHNIQNQPFLIWRRVQDYSAIENKYGHCENFKYVKPGVQLIFNDANSTFYEVYDPNMRQDLCEEVIYWNKSKDVKLILVNGVLLTDKDCPNPRQDKQYPFVKFGYELIDEGKCFYYKSLAFKMMQDANIINSLYPIIIDGSYLSVIQPMVVTGSEMIGSDVIVPGAVTNLASPDANLRPIMMQPNLAAGLNVLTTVEESINESSAPPIQSGGKQTAYSIAVQQKEAQTILGLFIQMQMGFVKDYGKLVLSDILQYLTIGEASKIENSDELVYKTFLLHDKESNGKVKTKKIKFDKDLSSEPMTEAEYTEQSFNVLKEQGGEDSSTTLSKVNPELFRNLKYVMKISPDIMTPMTQEAKTTLGLEIYDRAIANPVADQEQVTRDFLFGEFEQSKKNVDKYITKKNPVQDNMMAQLFGKEGLNQNTSQQLTPGMEPNKPVNPLNPPVK
jgi:hypothetical protein